MLKHGDRWWLLDDQYLSLVHRYDIQPVRSGKKNEKNKTKPNGKDNLVFELFV